MNCYLPHTSVPPSVFPISVKSTVLYYLLINCSIYHACNPLESRNVAVIFLVMLVTQPCPALCNIMDCSLPGCYVYGILQTRTLEWVAISFSRGSSCSRDQTWVSCIAGEFLTNQTTREAHRDGLVISKWRQTQVSKVRDSSLLPTLHTFAISRWSVYAPKTETCLSSLPAVMKYLFWHEIIQSVFKTGANVYLTGIRNAES